MKKLISMRLDADVIKKARAMAKHQNRSLSNFVEITLMYRVNAFDKIEADSGVATTK